MEVSLLTAMQLLGSRSSLSPRIQVLGSESPKLSGHNSQSAFIYDRASPSVRWPHLHHQITDGAKKNSLTPNETLQKGKPGIDLCLSPKPSSGSSGQNANDVHSGEDPRERDASNASVFHSVSRKPSDYQLLSNKRKVRKRSKLALRKAKDWRERVFRLSQAICGLEFNYSVADVLDHWPEQLTPTDYCFAVKQVGSTHWQRALELFEWLNMKHWYTPNNRMLSSLLGVLGRVNQVSLAEEIFQRAEAGIGDCVQVFNAMISVHAKHGNWERIQALVHTMLEKGCERDLITYNILITARAKAGLVPGMAMELLLEIWRAGLRPDTVTYNTLISACSSNNCYKEAILVFKEMKEHGCTPDIWTYNSMIAVYGRCGLDALAEEVYQTMKLHDISPDVVTYSSILNAFAKTGRIDDVNSIFRQMKEAGFCLDPRTYNTVIHMYGQYNLPEKALLVYEEMKASKCRPDPVTFTVLIDGLGKAGLPEEAERLFQEMEDAGIEPTLNTYSAMICAYAKGSMYKEAERKIENMLTAGIRPDALAYSVMLDVFLNIASPDKVLKVYQSMIREGHKPGLVQYEQMILLYMKESLEAELEGTVRDLHQSEFDPIALCKTFLKLTLLYDARVALTYAISRGLAVDNNIVSSLLNAFVRSGNFVEARSVCTELRMAGHVPPLQICKMLLSFACKAGSVESAEFFLKEMDDSGYDADVYIYNSMISLYNKVGSFREASQIFHRMVSTGVTPDSSTYNSLIHMYTSNLMVQEAIGVLQQMRKAGCLPDFASYTNLLVAYGRLNMWEQATALFKEMQVANIRTNETVYHTMLNVYRKAGRPELAQELVDQMRELGVEPTATALHMLMDSYGKSGQLEETQEMFDEMLNPNVMQYTSVIDAYLAAEEYEVATAKLKSMQMEGIVPNHVTWTCFVSAASKCQESSTALMLLKAINDAGFSLPLQLLTMSCEDRNEDLETLLERQQSNGPCFEAALFNVLHDLLWAFNKRATAADLFHLAVEKNIYDLNLTRVQEEDWGADFCKLSPGAALTGSTLWLIQMQEAAVLGNLLPSKLVLLITGSSKFANHLSVSKTLKSYLWAMGSPFLDCKARAGVLVAKGYSLCRWLKDSPKCRSLQLLDSPTLPKFNTMQLYDQAWMCRDMVPIFKQIEEFMGTELWPKKFSRLAHLEHGKRLKAMAADLKGREEKRLKEIRKKKSKLLERFVKPQINKICGQAETENSFKNLNLLK